jgi:anti-repressor protein
MNEIVFRFEEKNIRLVDIDGEAWFVARDVCYALGFSNSRQATTTHVDNSDVQLMDTPTSSGIQKLNYVNESGMYALIFGSTKPEAKIFKKWVTSTVLPSIRKNGGYITGQENDDPELIMAKALQVAQSVIERKSLELKKANETIALQATKVEFVEKYINSSSGSLGFRKVAKLLNVKEPVLRAFLAKEKIMYKLGGDWVPYQNHIEAGRFEVKAGLAEHEESSHAFTQSKFTAKGVEWVAGEYAKHKISEQLESVKCQKEQ